MKRGFVVLLVLAAWAAMVASGAAVRESGPGAKAPDAVRVTILHVADVHGELQTRTVFGKSVGGYARLATLVRDERAASDAARVFLIHGGDEFSRGDDLTRATLGAANIAIMNHLKFDMWVPGNGDHYDGPKNLLARARQAQFPVLSANVRVAATGEPIGKPFIIEKAGPVRLAFLGLCFVNPQHAQSFKLYNVESPGQVARKLVPELRKQADAVIVLSHLGVSDDEDLAAAVPGIDVILGSHTHVEWREGLRVKGPDGREVLICQAGEQLHVLGRLLLAFGKADSGYRLVSAADRLIPIDAQVQEDATVKALIAKLAAAAPKPKPGTKTQVPEPVAP